MAVTCRHVIDTYRRRILEDSNTIFQFGDAEIIPLERIIDESVKYDLATFDLDGVKPADICGQPELGITFFEPSNWPPRPVKLNDAVCLGGYPGNLREHPTPRDVVFGSFSAACVPVASVNDNGFTIQFERDYWVNSFGGAEGISFKELGGMSGCPVFIERKRGGILSSFDFVGIVYEYVASYDLIRARHAHIFKNDGTILS